MKSGVCSQNLPQQQSPAVLGRKTWCRYVVQIKFRRKVSKTYQKMRGFNDRTTSWVTTWEAAALGLSQPGSTPTASPMTSLGVLPYCYARILGGRCLVAGSRPRRRYEDGCSKSNAPSPSIVSPLYVLGRGWAFSLKGAGRQRPPAWSCRSMPIHDSDLRFKTYRPLNSTSFVSKDKRNCLRSPSIHSLSESTQPFMIKKNNQSWPDENTSISHCSLEEVCGQDASS